MTTPALVKTFPLRRRPVETEVVPSWPAEFRKARELVAKENMVLELNVAVLLKAVEEAKVSAPVHAPDEAKVTKPGFVHASVFPEKERPVPPKVVVWRTPDEFAERRVPVAAAKTVLLLKVAVELKVAPPVKVWRFVHAPDEAKVTKPGFVKLTVSAPRRVRVRRERPGGGERGHADVLDAENVAAGRDLDAGRGVQGHGAREVAEGADAGRRCPSRR